MRLKVRLTKWEEVFKRHGDSVYVGGRDFQSRPEATFDVRVEVRLSLGLISWRQKRPSK